MAGKWWTSSINKYFYGLNNTRWIRPRVKSNILKYFVYFAGTPVELVPQEPTVSCYCFASPSATNWKHWFSPQQNFIPFKLNLQKDPWTRALEKYTDMLSFTLKNTHTISECLESKVREEKKKEREQTVSYWLSGRYATQLVQTTKRGEVGESEITQKIKSCLWKIWSTSQNTQTFPTSTFLRYAVISYGWPFLSPSVRLLSPLHSAFQAPPAPRPHQSTSQSGLVSGPQPLPPQNPLPKPTVHTWQSLDNSLKEQHYTTNCSLAWNFDHLNPS